jgi:LytS/YehU family sensor histidine kinase
MLMAHYGIPVLFSAYFVPIMFALIYNDKRILLFSYIGSACAFIGCCVLYATVLARLPRPEVFREGFHSGDVITTLALLTAAYFICRIIIKRYGEIIELLMTKERELNESKVAIMLSQIQPHFLYNALTAITQLCDENPKKAKETTIDFSEYLRGNMDSLNEKRLISIEKELNHVKGYLNLEKAIYGKALNIVYRVETDDVSLPPLTIQPVVENAVKHGIGKKEGGGTITVSVCETEESYLVIVSDDGAGYDVNERSPDKRQHIGIDNVRQRLGQCGGTLELLSELGKGTTATIKLPKERHIVQ